MSRDYIALPMRGGDALVKATSFGGDEVQDLKWVVPLGDPIVS